MCVPLSSHFIGLAKPGLVINESKSTAYFWTSGVQCPAWTQNFQW
jgi:hypothetical protein